MKTRLVRNLIGGLAALFTTFAAHAVCIDTGVLAFGGSDVGLMGCGASSPVAIACDMNGTQLRWATHGTLVVDTN